MLRLTENLQIQITGSAVSEIVVHSKQTYHRAPFSKYRMLSCQRNVMVIKMSEVTDVSE